MVSDYQHLLPLHWKSKIQEYLQEDCPSFDYGGYVVGDKPESATLYGKSDGILAGVPFFTEIFKLLDCSVEWLLPEGTILQPIQKVAHVKGPAKNILLGERIALNLLARASGIATRANQYKTKVKDFTGIVAGTRKTTPGFRIIEKYALIVGGIDTHRMDLSSMIMLKDNHIWSQGSITRAVKKAKSVGGFSVKVEVECRSQLEAEEAISAGADIVMLDNMTPGEAKSVANALKQMKSEVLLEVSGGINYETIQLYADPNIDIISVGSIIQGAPIVDFSLKIDRK